MVKVKFTGSPKLSSRCVSRKVPLAEVEAVQNAVAVGTGKFIEEHRRWLAESYAAAQTKIAGGDLVGN